LPHSGWRRADTGELRFVRRLHIIRERMPHAGRRWYYAGELPVEWKIAVNS
jgi:hypothetical protein